MSEQFLINIKIAGKEYPLTIERNEEQEKLVRAAAAQINAKILQYQSHFSSAQLEMRDLLAMVALQLSVENLQYEDKNDTSPFVDKIQQLSQELETYLNQ